VPIEFPYSSKRTPDFGLILTPYVWLEVKTAKGVYRSQRFLFDTGADFTSFPKSMSRVVGVELSICPQKVMYTANNEPMITFQAKVKVRFAGEEFDLPCVFTDRDDTPFLLGRVGFIEKFEMFLSAKYKRLSFEKK